MRGERELPKTSSRWGTAEAEALLVDCRRRGVSLADYWRRRKIGYERLRRWRSRLDSEPRGPQTPALLPVHVLESERPWDGPGFELELARGLRLRVPPYFDEASLARLLRLVAQSG